MGKWYLNERWSSNVCPNNPRYAEYSSLHDYVFNYSKDYENTIKVAFSEVGEPIRDNFLDDSKKISKIGDVDVIISQYEKMYVATFKCKGIYFDIETNGITEEELVNLLESIIEELH